MANQLKEDLVLNTGQFDEKIEKVINKVDELKRKGSKVGSGFQSSMNGIIGSVRSFSKALGAVGLAVSAGGIVSWMRGAIDSGVELVHQAEGVRMAFERINRPDLLDNLREATHGTVDDITLMKQAIKFDDFNLSVDELGTYLAFAQQKAKDTGESIDYLVNSIVTGLGRKSLPILDNLGLSAEDIKNKMKEGGDMTTAVAAIIRERMSEVGDYIETANDKAARKQAEYNNKLLELGETFAPLKESAGDFYHSLKMGAIDAINALQPLIDMLSRAGQVRSQYNELGGADKLNRLVDNLRNANDKQGVFSRQQEVIWRRVNSINNKIKETQEKIDTANNAEYSQALTSEIEKLQVKKEALLKFLDDYKKEADKVLNPKTPTKQTTDDDGSTGNTKTNKNVLIYREEATTIAQITENIRYLEQAQRAAEPNSEVYKDVTKELENWRRKLLLVDFDDTAFSVRGIQKNISVLREKLNQLDPNSDEFRATYRELEKWEDKLESIDTIIDNLKFDENADTIEEIDQNIAILQNKLKGVVKDSKEWLEIQQDLMYWTDKRNSYQIPTSEEGSTKFLREQLAEIETMMEEKALSEEELNLLAIKKRDLEDIIALREREADISKSTQFVISGNLRTYLEQFKNLKASAQQIQEWWEDGLLSEEQADEAVKRIQEAIKKGNFPSIEIELVPIWKKKYEKIRADAQSIYGGFEGIDSVVNAIDRLDDAIAENKTAWEIFMTTLNVVMSTINAVGDVMETITTLTKIFSKTSVQASEAVAAATAKETAQSAANASAKSSEAVANATASGAKMPFPYNLVAIAAGIAAVVGALALMGTFANGGIVGGNSYAGDNLIARVNSGEMILNQNQQKNLFKLLDGGASTSSPSGDVHFVIQGKDLVGTLSNYNKINSKLR